MTAHGHFHWNELMTRDVEAAKAFYAATLGWAFNGMEMPGMTYWVAMAGEQPVGGIMDISGPEWQGVAPGWFAYIAVDDIDARLAKAVAAGAVPERPAFDVPGVGRICILKQPDGAHVGWMTPAAM